MKLKWNQSCPMKSVSHSEHWIHCMDCIAWIPTFLAKNETYLPRETIEFWNMTVIINGCVHSLTCEFCFGEFELIDVALPISYALLRCWEWIAVLPSIVWALALNNLQRLVKHSKVDSLMTDWIPLPSDDVSQWRHSFLSLDSQRLPVRSQHDFVKVKYYLLKWRQVNCLGFLLHQDVTEPWGQLSPKCSWDCSAPSWAAR